MEGKYVCVKPGTAENVGMKMRAGGMRAEGENRSCSCTVKNTGVNLHRRLLTEMRGYRVSLRRGENSLFRARLLRLPPADTRI